MNDNTLTMLTAVEHEYLKLCKLIKRCLILLQVIVAYKDRILLQPWAKNI